MNLQDRRQTRFLGAARKNRRRDLPKRKVQTRVGCDSNTEGIWLCSSQWIWDAQISCAPHHIRSTCNSRILRRLLWFVDFRRQQSTKFYGLADHAGNCVQPKEYRLFVVVHWSSIAAKRQQVWYQGWTGFNQFFVEKQHQKRSFAWKYGRSTICAKSFRFLGQGPEKRKSLQR